MKPEFAQPRVVIRPTLPSDTPDVLEFCKHIWGGHDYIPYVWDEWLADPHGTMFTAEYAGHAVGIARIARITSGQWWLEGFRVAPQHQDKKIGSQLHEYIVNWWLDNGDGVIRLWTNAKRIKVQHLCQRLGFVKTQEHAMYTASPFPMVVGPGEAPRRGKRENVFTPLAQAEIPAATAFVLACTSLPFTGGQMDLGWRVATPDENGLRQLLDWPDGRVLWWRDRQGLIGVWENDEHDDLLPMLGLAACKTEDLPALLLDFRRYTAQNGYPKAAWNAFLSPELDANLTSAGFARADDDSNFQFERIHPTRPSAG